MIRKVNGLVLSQVSQLIKERTGLYFSNEKWVDLERALHGASFDLGFENVELFCDKLISDFIAPEDLEILAAYLTVGETYFFREEKSFKILEEKILPELIQSRTRKNQKYLRIWSAGCSTGEEPYSIAILLDRLIPDIDSWSILILATDINTQFLKKAMNGIYSEWSFRQEPEWLKQKYFKKIGKNTYDILPQIRSRVTFSYHNLAQDPYPSYWNNTNAMDLVFCRNVLIYFSQDQVLKITQNLSNSLVENGWLVVSACEAPMFHPIPNLAVQFAEGILKKLENEFLRIFETDLKLEVEEAFSPKIFPASDSEKVSHSEIEEHEDDFCNWVFLAKNYANQGKLDLALEWIEKALCFNNLNPECHYLLAMIHLEKGKSEEAHKELERVLYLNPSFISAHLMLGTLAAQTGEIRKSRKHYESALTFLKQYRAEDVPEGLEEITAGRLIKIIQSNLGLETNYEPKKSAA